MKYFTILILITSLAHSSDDVVKIEKSDYAFERNHYQVMTILDSLVMEMAILKNITGAQSDKFNQISSKRINELLITLNSNFETDSEKYLRYTETADEIMAQTLEFANNYKQYEIYKDLIKSIRTRRISK